MKTLGEKLKAARMEQKMSQNEVAEKLLVSRQSISKWENDICLPDLENFQKICELYQICPNEILNEASENVAEKEEKKHLDSLYFLIPFFALFILLRKRNEMLLFDIRERILMGANLVISVLLVWYVFSIIPQSTVQITQFV